MKLAHLRQTLRYAGPLFSAIQLVKISIPRRWFDVECFEMFECGIARAASDLNVSRQVGWATQNDLDALAGIDRFRNKSAGWLRAGARAVALNADEKTVACLWMTSGYHDQDDWLRFTLRPHEIWTITIWVHPNYRGRGYHAQLWTYAVSALAEEGYRKILGHIDVLNRRSIRAFKKVGAKPLRRVLVFRLFGWTLARRDGRVQVGRWSPIRRYEI
jgi:RimJ/RimL family protein N-acetyltransferase